MSCHTEEQEFKIEMHERKHENNFPLMRDFHLIVACEKNGGIGNGTSVPWRVPEDMKFFKEITTKIRDKNAEPSKQRRNAIIMGRHTWDSLLKKLRPLNSRLNVILSSTLTEADVYNSMNEDKAQRAKENGDVLLIHGGLLEALRVLAQPPYIFTIESVFCIGGACVYSQAVHASCARTLRSVLITRILVDCEACTHFFHFPPNPTEPACKDVNKTSKHICNYSPNNNISKLEYESCKDTSNNVNDNKVHRFEDDVEWIWESTKGKQVCTEINVEFEIVKYVKRNKEEEQYINLADRIIKDGITKSDRTGVGTRSLFGCQMRYSLRNNRLPLLTTKRVFWRGVCEELLWFIRGETNAQLLNDKNVHIWDENGSRAFLDSRGLTNYEEMDLGPVYGFQWRHFNAPYDTCHSNYNGKGVDQLKQIIHTLKTNPTDRRMILTAWNPCALPNMALPPCHMMAEFYVDTTRNELSCMMIQRSCDMGLGVPFNIASYSLLTILLAKATGLKPGEFVHTLGDAHVYENHISALQEQFKRKPRQFPVLVFKNDQNYLEDYQFEDMELLDYEPYPTIKMAMAVEKRLQ